MKSVGCLVFGLMLMTNEAYGMLSEIEHKPTYKFCMTSIIIHVAKV